MKIEKIIKSALRAGSEHRMQLMSKVSPAGFYMIQVFTEIYLDVSLIMKKKFNFCYQHSSLIRCCVYFLHGPKDITLEEIFSFDYAGVCVLF